MRSVRLLVACALMVTMLAWAGCGTGGGGTGGKLEGINWVLKTYDSKGASKAAPAGVSVDALFENGKVGGFSGVNTYQGQYKLSGNSLTIGQIASTLMAGPQNLMDLEQVYLADLQQVASCSADAVGLTLFNGNGRQVLTYTKGEASQ